MCGCFSNLYSPLAVLLQGTLAGLLFGFFLQKGKVSKFDVIVNQLLLKDFTVLKIMLTAVVVGGLGIYTFLNLGWLTSLSITPKTIVELIVGGIIFGTGMAVLGFCPGTVVAAAGEGAKDAWFGILGLVTGVIIYAEIYPWVQTKIFKGTLIQGTLTGLTGVSPWFLFLLLGILIYFGSKAVKKLERKR
ncbi:YeeE/YedE family protein [Candidatus Babeliales bacterium]|nr:YeeE/YedE family protein [Candidatus Babeliales bacterium]